MKIQVIDKKEDKDKAKTIQESSKESKVFRIYSKTQSSYYSILLSNSVKSDLTKYWDVVEFLNSEVEEGDTVEIKIANYGGDLHTGVALAHAMKNCSATVVANVIANCYSMGAILALCGDALAIQAGNFLMFHNFSSFEFGKANEIELSHTAHQKSFKDYLHYFCRPFLTKGEVSAMIKGHDLYIHYDEDSLNKRLKRHFKRQVVEQ